MARRSTRVPWRLALTVGVAVGLVTNGCQLLGFAEVPEEVVEPSVVGLIAELEQQDDGVHIQLEDGTSLVIPIGAEAIYGGPEVGNLLVYGNDGRFGQADGAWYAAVRPLPSGCFDLPANGEVRGDRIALSYGFSLPLSDEWSETETRFVESPPVGFCLDESGAVTRTN